jgi:hypothetical protein
VTWRLGAIKHSFKCLMKRARSGMVNDMSCSFKSQASTHLGSNDYGQDLANHFGGFDSEFYDRRVVHQETELQETPRSELRESNRA